MAPQPDAVLTGGGGINISVPSSAGSVSAGDKTDYGSLATGGRSPAVLIVRELLYRACEFSTNYDLDKDEAKAFYLKHLDALSGIISSQTESGDSALSSAVASSDDD